MSTSAKAEAYAPPGPTAPSVSRCLDHVANPRVAAAVRVGSEARRALGEFLRSRGFVEIAPVIVAPVTDPLNHPVSDPQVDYYGHTFQLTRSMIFHKQMALLGLEKVFCFSPNLRFEPLDRRGTGRHLVEFTQVDLEARGAVREDMLRLGEELIRHTVSEVTHACASELRDLSRTVPELSPRFPRVEWTEAHARFGGDFEKQVSTRASQPTWVLDIPLQEREFYDREDPERPGLLLDMDLLYPEGYGEALSGGEREFEMSAILRRIAAKGQHPEQFRWYLDAVRRGLSPSCGFGIGVERLTRWLCGLPSVDETTLFPRRIGEWCL